MKNYQIIAQNLRRLVEAEAARDSDKTSAHEKERQHTRINAMRAGAAKFIREHFPSGSGVDNGTELNWGKSRPERLVFNTAYHHMNDAGVYDGWTHHEVVVTPSLVMGIRLRITGRDRNDIKGYLGDIYDTALEAEQPYVSFEFFQ